jgi:hypothetical protein
MGSWQTSGTITSRAWSVVRGNPYMLAFPVIGAVLGVVALLVVGSAGLLATGFTSSDPQAANNPVGWLIAALAIYLAVLASMVAMAGLTFCANEELRGRDSSVGAGLSAALRRFPAIAGWAGIQTLVGWLLSAVRGNGSSDNVIVAIVRLIAAALLSVAWSLITFFVLPFIVLRGVGPIAAIKSSFALLRSTWGNQLSGSVRIGGIMALVAVLPGLLLVVGGGFLSAADKLVLGVPMIGLGALWMMVGSVFLSAIRAVFSVALFIWATEREPVGPFSSAELSSAIRVR